VMRVKDGCFGGVIAKLEDGGGLEGWEMLGISAGTSSCLLNLSRRTQLLYVRNVSELYHNSNGRGISYSLFTLRTALVCLSPQGCSGVRCYW